MKLTSFFTQPVSIKSSMNKQVCSHFWDMEF